jgi:hypothetical protein
MLAQESFNELSIEMVMKPLRGGRRLRLRTEIDQLFIVFGNLSDATSAESSARVTESEAEGTLCILWHRWESPGPVSVPRESGSGLGEMAGTAVTAPTYVGEGRKDTSIPPPAGSMTVAGVNRVVNVLH